MARRDGQKGMASEWMARKGWPELKGQQGFAKIGKGWPEMDEQRWPEWDGRKRWPERDGQKGMARKACPDGGPERTGIEDRQKREPEKRVKV